MQSLGLNSLGATIWTSFPCPNVILLLILKISKDYGVFIIYKYVYTNFIEWIPY